MKNGAAVKSINEHLANCGSETPVPEDKQDDLETLVRRVDEIRELGEEFGSVELSPFMESLLRVSGVKNKDSKAETTTLPISA